MHIFIFCFASKAFVFNTRLSLEIIASLPPNRFPLDEQMNMKSVVDYFREMYGYTIKYSHLPCLQVGNEKKVNYLPMEVSYVRLFLEFCLKHNFLYIKFFTH